MLFVVLVLAMAYVYASQPARKESWAHIREKWRTLRRVFRDEPSVLVAPFDWSTVELHGLAQFEEKLEFLGCDVAITRDQEGTHVWQVTIWRALTSLEHDYTLYMHFVRPSDDRPFFAQADHLLGRQLHGGTMPTSQWEPGAIVLDAVKLPEEVQPETTFETRVGVWIPKSELRLEPETNLLEVDEHGRLVICQ